MSLGTLLGFISGFGLIIGAIIMSTDKAMVFINLPSVIIVLGGTLATVFISYEAKTGFKALNLMIQSFLSHKDSATSLKEEVGRIVRWGYVVQKNGLQGLETEVTDAIRAKDPFIGYGADLVVTGYTGAEIRQILVQSLEAREQRSRKATDALKKMGGDAPAFGMLGTLIGLVIMLGSMGSDPGAIGPSMAVALITTFYGVFLARVLFIPLATKMSAREDTSLFKNVLQVEGLILLAERKSPRYIQDKLNAFVDIQEQFLIDRDMNSNIGSES